MHVVTAAEGLRFTLTPASCGHAAPPGGSGGPTLWGDQTSVPFGERGGSLMPAGASVTPSKRGPQ